MSTEDEMYRVLYIKDGREVLTDPEPRADAEAAASALDRGGYAVGAVMSEHEARGYMQDRYATTYRGVAVPEDLRANGASRTGYDAWKRGVDSMLDGTEGATPAGQNPFAPDLTMSREVADYVLRSTTGLLEDGYWPKAYDTASRFDGADQQPYDMSVVRKAADIVGRDKIENAALRQALADLDSEDDPLRGPVCTDPGCPAGYPHHGPCPGDGAS